MNGAAKIALSKRSNIPPWPGIILPLSLTNAWRLYFDSTKSPKVPNILTKTLIINQFEKLKEGAISAIK